MDEKPKIVDDIHIYVHFRSLETGEIFFEVRSEPNVPLETAKAILMGVLERIEQANGLPKDKPPEPLN